MQKNFLKKSPRNLILGNLSSFRIHKKLKLTAWACPALLDLLNLITQGKPRVKLLTKIKNKLVRHHFGKYPYCQSKFIR
jgi:hypothetical protein